MNPPTHIHCTHFTKEKKGRGKPSPKSFCAVCETVWTDHYSDPSRDHNRDAIPQPVLHPEKIRTDLIEMRKIRNTKKKSIPKAKKQVCGKVRRHASQGRVWQCCLPLGHQELRCKDPYTLQTPESAPQPVVEAPVAFTEPAPQPVVEAPVASTEPAPQPVVEAPVEPEPEPASKVCTHPDHVDDQSCEDRAVGCSPDCSCCIVKLVVEVPVTSPEPVEAPVAPERMSFDDLWKRERDEKVAEFIAKGMTAEEADAAYEEWSDW